MMPTGLHCLMPLSVLRELPVKGHLQYYPGEPGHCTVTVHGDVGQDVRDKIAVANDQAIMAGGIKKSTLTPISHLHVIRAVPWGETDAKDITWKMETLQFEHLHMLGDANAPLIHFHDHSESGNSRLLLVTFSDRSGEKLQYRLDDVALPAPLSAFIKRVYLKAETFVVNKTDVFGDASVVKDCARRMAMLPYCEAHELSEEVGGDQLSAFFSALQAGEKPHCTGITATVTTTMTGWQISDDIVLNYVSADGEKKTKSLPAQ